MVKSNFMILIIVSMILIKTIIALESQNKLFNSKKLPIEPLNTVECDKNCAVCTADKDNKPQCIYCVKNFLIQPNTCLKSIDTSNTKCLMFAQDALCQFCLPGYALDPYNNQNGQTQSNSFCFKIDNPKSIVAISNGSFKDGKFFYSLCDGGHPAQDRSECVDFQSSSTCKWGALDQNYNVYCFKCKKGYISDGGTIPQCIIDDQSTPGCLMRLYGQKACGACDIWENWYMKNPGVCVKN